MEISQSLIRFVAEHASDDVNALRLKYSGKSSDFDFPLDFALLQIEARKKTRKKIPDFLSHDGFIFPTMVAAEQASNQAVAAFHASLLKPDSSLLDLTAGLGVDDISFSLHGVRVTACEIEQLKCEALRHNSKTLGVSDRIEVINADSIEFLRTLSDEGKLYDIIFADPARRDSKGARVHALGDCTPDILEAMPLIQKVAPRLIVKSSPLLDLSLIVDTVANLSHIYMICFRGECKEVLIEVSQDSDFSGVDVVDLDFDSVISRFHSDFYEGSRRGCARYAERSSSTDYKYLYEPNAGVMKTGDWNALQAIYTDLEKADHNTHIFLSDTEYTGFPGRVLSIESMMEKKSLKSLKGEKLNVVARNHPLQAPDIYKKYGLKPGSDNFLYAFRYRKTPVMLKAKSLQK